MSRLWNRLAVAGLAAAMVASVPDARADDFALIDFPINARKKTPDRLASAPRQVATPDGIGYAEVVLNPARKDERVFLTFVFDEDGRTTSLGVFWRGDQSGEQITLSKNLAEGVRGLNRRTIPLPPEAGEEGGRIYITGRQDRLLRMRIDWCEPVATFVASDQERPALVAGGRPHVERDLGGDPILSPPDAWLGNVLDAALQDGVSELSEPVEFVVPLEGPAESARFRARFLGLPLGRGVRVWVNGEFAGRMVPDAPPLTDPGYVRKAGQTVYAGWREGGLYIEPGVLKEGDNSILLQATDSGVFIRGAAIEIEASPVSEVPVETPNLQEMPDLEIGR